MGGKGGVKHNRYFSRGGKRPAFGGRGHSHGENAPSPRDDRDEFEIHDGSFKLEELKVLPEWEKRIIQPPSSVKRKYALCFGYLGSRYQGLQINPEAETIEKVLEKALLLAGGISEENFGNIQKISWSRTARTDKGVHALSQCCAMKLNFPLGQEEEFRRVTNTFLPDDIHIHYIQKVAKTFNSKFCCSGRKYHYILPTYLLFEETIITKFMNEAQEGKEGEDGKTLFFLQNEQIKSIREKHLKGYRVSPEAIDRLKTAVNQFVGTHNYHNFTSSKDGSDASANRYITKFEVMEPFIDKGDGLEWVCLSICGQSFLLNQIRKMVTLAIEFARGKASLVSFEKAFDPKTRVDIPMAPGLGLYLNQLFFERYNCKVTENNKQLQAAKAKKEKKAAERKLKEQATNTATSAATVTDGDKMKITEQTDKESHPIKKQRAENGESLDITIDDVGASSDGGDGKEHELTSHSPIEWASHAEVGNELVNFERDKIQPHIIDEEYKSFAFLQFMDYLRVNKCSYPLD